MEDYHEISIKNICCTCLSTERNLSQLCRVDDGVNDLFFLLSYKSEAYEAIFIKDLTQLFICWECVALMQRFSKFRKQVYIAHSKLTDIIDGKVTYSNIKTLSKLSIGNQIGYGHGIGIKEEDPMDCGPADTVIKFESDTDDEPLAQLRDLHTEEDGENIDLLLILISGFQENIDKITVNSPDTKDGVKNNKRKAINKDIPFVEISIDNDKVNDYNDLSQNDSLDDFDYSEIRNPEIYKGEIKKTHVPAPIVKNENSCLYESKTMLNNKKIGCITRKSDSETEVKSQVENDTSTIDFENDLDTEMGKALIERKEIRKKGIGKKVSNKNVQSNVNIPIANGDNIMSKRKENEEKNKGYVPNKAPRKVTKNVCINLIQLNNVEMCKSIEARKLKDDYVNAMNKCEECIEIFEDCDNLEKHITELHEPKPNTKMCNICKVYVKLESLDLHEKEHCLEWKCQICKESLLYKFKCMENVRNHLKTKHYMQDAYLDTQMEILSEQEDKIVKNEDKIVKNEDKIVKNKKSLEPEKPLTVMIDDPKGSGFACLHCKQYFRSKNMRNNHVQKCHTEGFQCSRCGKKFAMTYALIKHELVHCNPRPRQQCQVCGKMVRADLFKVHGLKHDHGKQYSCVPCNKTFNSPFSYRAHLKLSRQHTERAALKYKCSVCGKDYRSAGELRDHHNYTHESKTIHKCPICHKALASAGGVKIHVKRAHEEKTVIRDKICQTCGKGFTNQTTLIEHEWIHTGERPLSCDLCSRAFRQKAALYTHKRLVHKVPLKKKIIQHTDDNTVVNTEINKDKD